VKLEVLYCDDCPSPAALSARLRMLMAQAAVVAPMAGARSPRPGRAAPAAVVQKALLMNSSVGLGLGKVVSLPGLASVKNGRNTVPCESRPW
jgi:hypothetical protein